MSHPRSDRPDYDVIVVGAGVGGASLALALAQRPELRVLLVDRRSGPGNINRGDSLLPAVTRQLRAWGALDAMVSAGARTVGKMQVFHGATRLYEAPLASGSDAPYLVLPHPEIERALVATAATVGRVEVRYRCRLVRVIEQRGRVCGAVLSNVDGREDEVRARLVIGADGSSSTLRQALGISLATKAYDHGFYIVDIERPRGYEDAMRVELSARGNVLVVPQGQDRVGLGVLVHREETDLFRAASLEEKRAALVRRSPLFADAKMFADGAHLYRLVRGHAPRYVARGAALMGDAVHVTNPTVGQGMTMAIEDASALAKHVAAVLSGGGCDEAIDRALFAYEAERRPRNDALIRWSHWLSRFYALGGPLGDRLRRSVFRLGGVSVGRSIHQLLWSRMATREAT